MTGGWLAWECAVFAVFVCASTFAPLWKRKDKGGGGGGERSLKREYIFAASTVSTFSMMLSVARGSLGVRSFLGFPSELVYFGAAMWETLYGMVLAFPLVCFLFLPIYFPLGVVSVYQYLELRFNSRVVRRLASATFVWRQLLNLAVTVYTPSVALHAVLGLPHWASGLAITLIGAFFTVMGGLSAAIRADVIQAVTMVGISLVLLIKGTVEVGGPARVIHDNVDGGRLQFFNFTWDLTTRVDTMSALIGQLFMSVSIYGCQQTFVQRYCSMPSESKVRKTLMLNVPVVAVLFSLSWVVGMALYSVFRHCDPLATGSIASMDEVLPYYVRTHCAVLPGLLGLFLGSLFNGALSFLVSNVNSLATVTWEDFISALPIFRDFKDKKQLNIIKIIGVIYGVLILVLSLGVGAVGGVVEGSQLVTSATSGPLLGVFLMAALIPPVNGKGAVAGMVTSHIVTTWMAVGHMIYDSTKKEMLPLLTDGCTNSTITDSTLKTGFNRTLQQIYKVLPHIEDQIQHKTIDEPSIPLAYATSYMWYAAIGTFVCIFVGLLVSLVTAQEKDTYSERLLHPLALRMSRALPGRPRIYREPVSAPPSPPPTPVVHL